MNTLKKLIDKKIQDVKLNFSNGTLRFYLSHLNHFLKWCNLNNIETIDDFKEDQLIQYISDMKATSSNTTINKRVGILKRVYQYSNVNFDFLYSIKKLKETKKRFDIIDKKDLHRILKYANSSSRNLYKLLIHLLIDTGARINEIMNIKKSDIKLSENEILLTTTKTKVDRVVYFLDDTKKIIYNVLKENNPSVYLFYNKIKNRQIKYDDVRYYMRLIKEKLHLKKIHPHMFRHTFATTMIKNQANLITIKEIMGHQNIETTELYIHMTSSYNKKTYLEKFQK